MIRKLYKLAKALDIAIVFTNQTNQSKYYQDQHSTFSK
jgi:hypothetical protein